MFYNLKIAFRNLRRNGIYSVVNIVGLSVSLTAAILILLWVQDELSYDRFHKKGKDIYQTIVTFNMNNQDLYWKASSMPLAPRSMEEIPGIKDFCRVQHIGSVKFRYNDNESPTYPMTFVDTSFFSMFSFNIIDGDARNPFSDKQAIVLSQDAAQSLFGDDDPIGKIIENETFGTFHVTAVMKNMPLNTNFMSDFLCTMDLLYDLQGGKEVMDQRWGQLGILTFFLLNSDSDPAKIAEGITELNNRHLQEHPMTYYLQPLTQNHFYNEKGRPNSNMQTSRLFTIATFVLLFIACINFVNLVTARVSKRNKEISLRNILGAKKSNIFFQSMTESFILFLIAVVVATVLLYVMFPIFKEISGKNMALHIFSWKMLSIYLIVLVVVTLLAGIFPALNLAFRKPMEILGRNVGKDTKGVLVRQILVVLQFTAAITLIMGAVTIGKQMQYVRHKDLGYNKEDILSIHLGRNMIQHKAAIKSELERQTSILGITFSSQDILWAGNASGWFSPEDPNKSLMLGFISTDKEFIPTMQMELLEGSNFTDSPADSAHFILNETAVRATGIKDPVSKPFIFQPDPFSNTESGKIIGVVKDFHFKDLHIPIEPMVLCYQGDPKIMYLRVNATAAQQAVEEVGKLWQKYNPKESFNYVFLDDTFDSYYHSDIRVNKLFVVFAIIAIFVSCLGLFGLITYTAETKTKEIGIRKVLGASVGNIVKMLSKEFMILVGIAMLVAFPLAYFWLKRMLQDYAYRVSISWWVFASAAIITIVLTFLTVGFQAIKAATANPVKSIKTEG